MFYLTNTIFIYAAFLPLMTSIACCHLKVTVWFWISSKKAHWCGVPQNPLTLTSNLALSSLFAVACGRCSPERAWSGGSTHTSWHTSVKSFAMKLRISLWRIVGNPPVEQFKAWSTLNDFPHTHFEGSFDSCQPYLKERASQKAPLWREKPWHSMGRATNQLDDPFLLAFPAVFVVPVIIVDEVF